MRERFDTLLTMILLLMRSLQANILITETRQACLADFGLALLAETLSSSEGMTSSSTSSKGTLRWAAPEVLDPSKKEHDARKRDIYAFACSVLEVRPYDA